MTMSPDGLGSQELLCRCKPVAIYQTAGLPGRPSASVEATLRDPVDRTPMR
jgi:hypothetical protein